MNHAHLTLAYWCVLVAALLPILCVGLAKATGAGKSVRHGGYDNGDPRSWLAGQTGWRARADRAHANGFEALPFFIGAVVIAHQIGAEQGRLDTLACAYIGLRLAYIGCYLAGWASARSVVWVSALAVNIAIFLPA